MDFKHRIDESGLRFGKSELHYLGGWCDAGYLKTRAQLRSCGSSGGDWALSHSRAEERRQDVRQT